MKHESWSRGVLCRRSWMFLALPTLSSMSLRRAERFAAEKAYLTSTRRSSPKLQLLWHKELSKTLQSDSEGPKANQGRDGGKTRVGGRTTPKPKFRKTNHVLNEPPWRRQAAVVWITKRTFFSRPQRPRCFPVSCIRASTQLWSRLEHRKELRDWLWSTLFAHG